MDSIATVVDGVKHSICPVMSNLGGKRAKLTPPCLLALPWENGSPACKVLILNDLALKMSSGFATLFRCLVLL
jgi:hypothetical protein